MYNKIKHESETSIVTSINIISFVEDTPKSIVPIWYVYGSNLSEGSGYEYKGKVTSEKVNNNLQRVGFFMINFVIWPLS